MKNVVFRDVALCGFIKNRPFEGTYCLHLQGKINTTSEKKCKMVFNSLNANYFQAMLFCPELFKAIDKKNCRGG
jgi:hypothetical protein